MGRRRVPWLLMGAMLVALCLPAGALAGTLSWDQPANFTATAPGANPDHDAYGGSPWSYREGAACTTLPLSSCVTRPSTDPTTSTLLTTFSAQGNPTGPVRVLFAYVRIVAGHTLSVRGTLPGYVAAALRRVHPLQVRVTVTLSGLGRVSGSRTVS